MNRHRFTAPATAAIALAMIVLLPGVFEASLTVVDGDGHILSVEIVTDSFDPSVQGLALVDDGPGGITRETILSTYDPIIDQNPSITLNPYDGQPVLVWSRLVGDDYELAMLRRLPSGAWSPFDILTDNETSDVEARPLVDPDEIAHILWWPNGEGGPVYLQSFDVHGGRPTTPPQRPLEQPIWTRRLRTTVIGGSEGGGDDPGIVNGHNGKASAYPCLSNPAAAPEHGVVRACGRPAAYQLSSCRLIVGVFDTTTATWTQTVSDLSSANLAGTSVREIVQALADARCN